MKKLRERDMPTLRLRAACLLAVVGSDAAFLSGGMAPRTPAMRRAAPRPLIRMQEAEAPEPEAGAAAADTTSAAEKWASRQEPAAAAPAAAPVPAPVVAAVDQAELDFEERLAMLASQVRHAPSGSGLGGRAGGRVGVTAETRRERAPLSVAVARAVRPALTHTLTHTGSASASAHPHTPPLMPRQIPASVPDAKDQYKTENIEKGQDESWISPSFYALCKQDLDEISWPARKQARHARHAR